jgi:hypothetical protein
MFGNLGTIIRRDRKRSFIEKCQEDLKKNTFNGRTVNLSFYNIPYNPNARNPTVQTKVIFDKNDPSGSLLHNIFTTDIDASLVGFYRNGVWYHGISLHIFSRINSELGVLKRMDDSTYYIHIVMPSSAILRELRNRNIVVLSHGVPLQSTVLTGAPLPHRGLHRYTCIYANRTDSIGAFNQNVLPR